MTSDEWLADFITMRARAEKAEAELAAARAKLERYETTPGLAAEHARLDANWQSMVRDLAAAEARVRYLETVELHQRDAQLAAARAEIERLRIVESQNDMLQRACTDAVKRYTEVRAQSEAAERLAEAVIADEVATKNYNAHVAAIALKTAGTEEEQERERVLWLLMSAALSHLDDATDAYRAARASKHCDRCDPSFSCFDGSATCGKVPL